MAVERYVKIREGIGAGGHTYWVPFDQVALPGPPGPPGVLHDDPDPTLAADLKLNNHGIVGELEEQSLVIDGGLL